MRPYKMRLGTGNPVERACKWAGFKPVASGFWRRDDGTEVRRRGRFWWLKTSPGHETKHDTLIQAVEAHRNRTVLNEMAEALSE